MSESGGESVTITLLGRPVPGSRAQSKYRWLPKRQSDALAALKVEASEVMLHRPMLDGPLTFEMMAEMPIPKTFSKRKHRDAIAGVLLPTTKPDLKNLLWLAEDALTSIVYPDDSLVCRHLTLKIYGPQPKLTITVSPYTKMLDTS